MIELAEMLRSDYCWRCPFQIPFICLFMIPDEDASSTKVIKESSNLWFTTADIRKIEQPADCLIAPMCVSFD
jgi:hypothetical protein